jgi:hypothetical protein
LWSLFWAYFHVREAVVNVDHLALRRDGQIVSANKLEPTNLNRVVALR